MILVGLTGMGGGALMTPVLISSSASSRRWPSAPRLTYAAVTKIASCGSTGARARWTSPWRSGSRSAASAWLIGVATIAYVKASYGGDADGVLYKAMKLGLMMVSMLIVKVVMHLDARAHRRENLRMTRRLKLMTVTLGLCRRFIIGFTSVGSGTLLAVFLILFLPLTTSSVIGTDIPHAMIVLVITGLGMSVQPGWSPRCSWAPSRACCSGHAHGQGADARAAHVRAVVS